jgi:shikimate dehydrogenase
MHNAAFAALGLPFVYIPFEVRPENLEPAIRGLSALGIVGANLTIPHKERVLPYLDVITEEALDVGAANTVHCVDGRLLGDNTDVRGFLQPLLETGFSPLGTQVAVIGAGGAARAVLFGLMRAGARVTILNRSFDRAVALAAAVKHIEAGSARAIPMDSPEVAAVIAAADLIVQTTRVGMHPEVEEVPAIPLDAMQAGTLVYDLVYNPIETRFLQEAQARGCRIMTGVKMLVYQGAASFERWTGVRPPTDVMERAVVGRLSGKASVLAPRIAV